MPKITRKIELYFDRSGLSEEECKERWRFIYQLNDNLYRIANRLVNQLYLADEIDDILRLSDQKYIDLRKKLTNKKLDEASRATLEEQMSELMQHINERRSAILQRPQQSFAYSVVTDGDTKGLNAKILDVLKQDVLSHYKADTKEVLRGEKSISNYKKGMPIPFAFNDSVKLYEEEGFFYLKWYNGVRFILHFGRDASNNQLIVERCLGLSKDGMGYKACSSSIQIKKMGITLRYSFCWLWMSQLNNMPPNLIWLLGWI